MTEILENIVSAYYNVKGYFTKTRVPVVISNWCEVIVRKKNVSNKPKRVISDIDVLAYKLVNKKRKELIMIEIKGWGSPEEYLNFNSSRRRDALVKIILKQLCVWNNFVDGSSEVECDDLDKFILIIPGDINNDAKKYIINSVIAKLSYDPKLNKCFMNKTNFIEILPIHELIEDIVKVIKADMYVRRKRYQSEALELIRWIIRIFKKI